MSYIKEHMEESFKDCKLELVEDGTSTTIYKLTPAGRFHWCYIIFGPLGVIIGGDQRFGEREGGQAVSVPGLDAFGFLGDHHPEYLGSKFFGRKPSGKVALSRWANDVGWLEIVQREFKRLVGPVKFKIKTG